MWSKPLNENALAAAVGGVMGLLLAALIGLVIGAVAKLLMPGRDPGGWFVTILLGIAGSWIGRVGLGVLGIQGPYLGLVAAVAGAMLILFVYRILKKS